MGTEERTPIQVAIIEDDELIADSLMYMISAKKRTIVTGVYYNLNAARDGLKMKTPDILLLDFTLPDGNGLDFIDEMINYPNIKIIMLTQHNIFNIAFKARAKKVPGYLLKNIKTANLFEAIEAVYEGKQYYCKATEKILKGKTEHDLIEPTRREKEILQYIAIGKSEREIAKICSVDKNTVASHKKSLRTAFKCHHSAEMIAIATEMLFLNRERSEKLKAHLKELYAKQHNYAFWDYQKWLTETF